MTLDALYAVYGEARARCRGARVLDYGCAEGQASLLLRQYGASFVQGIDISAVAVAHAAERAARAGVDNVDFRVMDAERLAFDDASFDLVFGIAILHHLDLSRALAEIARVLAPGGSAVFLEPLAHNPVLALVRRLTPTARTEDEHPLTVSDIAIARQHFGSVQTRYLNLATLGAAAFTGLPGSSRLHNVCRALDRRLLAIPGLQRYAWNVVLTMGHGQREGASH